MPFESKTAIDDKMSPSSNDLEKYHDTFETGEILSTGEALSAEEDRRLLRKIDLNLLVVLAASYLFQFLDKSALGYTAIMGLRTDLSMTGSEYSWSSGIYYFGYIVASYPVAWLLVRLPVGKTIAFSVLIWGAILMLTSTCFNAQGLLAIRFFLGATEAAIGPGLTIIVGMFYKRSEQPLRHGAWFMGNVVAGFVGGILAYAIGHVQSIAPWKAVFLVFGALTVSWSVYIYFFLPDTPATARFLNKEDRAKAIDRVRENMTGIRSDTWKWRQSFEALTDVKIWLLVILQLSQQIANGGVHGFGTIVIKGFGFTTLNTLLVQMISIIYQAVFVLVGTFGSSYFKNARTYFIALNLAISLAGAVMVREIDATDIWARFAGYCLCLAYSANFPLALSINSSNVAGFTKKNTANAMVFIAYCVGNIIGPQLFFEDEAPSYPSGFLSMIICFGAALILSIVLRFTYIWENRRRDAKTGGMVEVTGDQIETMNLADSTDKEMENFRYVY